MQNSAVRVDDSGNVNLSTMSASNFARSIGVAGVGGVFTLGQGGGWTQYVSTTDNDQYIQWVTHHSGVGQGIRMTLDIDGNFGIGTNTPAQKLHVVGNSIVSGNMGVGISANQKVEVSGGNISLGRIGAGAFTRIIGTGGSDGSMSLGTSGGSSIQFNQTNDSDNTIDFVTHHSGSSHAIRAHIDRDGNFGVGTTSPSEKLHVVGAGKLQTTSTVGAELILENTNTGGADWRLMSCGAADAPGAGLFGLRSYSDARWFIVINGGVGYMAIGNNGSGAHPNLTPTSSVSLYGSFALETYETATSVTLGSGGAICYVTSTASARTITLPPAGDCPDRVYWIMDKSGGAGTNHITIQPDGAELINAQATYVINKNYGGVVIQSDGSNWYILGEFNKSSQNLGTEGPNATAANDLDIGIVGDLITVSGNTEIQRIVNTGFTAGTSRKLLFSGTPTVKHNQSVTAGFSTILVDGNTDYVATAGGVVDLFFDGTNFYLRPYYTA